jgi:acetyl-CoA carboxylase carboxyltransferase component
MVDGRPVSWVRIAGGKRHGAIGFGGAQTAVQAVRTGIAQGIPVVAVLDTGGADIHEGVAALHAWGMLARAFADASGVVPTILAVTGSCVSGPALLLGLVDAVVMTESSFAYVTGPDAVAEVTGVVTTRAELGGAGVHDTLSGVASIVVTDDLEVEPVIIELLSCLPSDNVGDPPRFHTGDDPRRDCDIAAQTVPAAPNAAYDVRDVIDDVLDIDSFVELRAHHAPNTVIGFGRLDGHVVGVIANQPISRAGTLDIDSSRKAARFVSWCDSFNVPLLTLVDTPGFEPGRDLEWRGMIRHGAQLVHAYCAATVPRVCVILRKAYGGAYIVMDSRRIGNDICLAWPGAEIAVMGTAGALQILGNKGLKAEDYEDAFLNPWRAAERGVVDAVIDPRETRRVLVDAFAMLRTKRVAAISRKHSNGPL